MANKTVTATLCAHSGAVKISRNELANLSTPPRTLTHKPVAHSMVVDLVEAGLRSHGLAIEKEEYAVQTDGMKMFGVITLKHQTHPDFAFALGLRTSNDKTFPVQMIAGGNVFVCDNKVFSGDVNVVVRRHTSGLNIQAEISSGVDRAIQRFAKFGNRIQELKTIDITDFEAKSIILDAGLTGIIPLRLLGSVKKAYFEPPYAEFQPRTRWSLHNAFSESFKELRPNIAMQANVKLGRTAAFAL